MRRNFSMILMIFLLSSNVAWAQNESLSELNKKIEALADEVEALKIQQNMGSQELSSQYGLGPSASKVYSLKKKGISLGAYGEIIYTNKSSENESGAKVAQGNNPQVDTLRNIIYLGYKFSDRLVFNSEIEIEHADEISAEFVTLDYLYRKEVNGRVGLVLIPLGFVNELHEPVTFFSVNRPDIEQKIIPTTWRENGMGIFGEIDWFSYRFYLVNGLNAKVGTSNIGSDGVRNGRKKGSQAEARDLAWVGRFDFKPWYPLTVGTSIYLGKMGGVQTDVDHKVYDLHLEGNHYGARVRFLWVHAELDNTTRLNNELSLTGVNGVGSELNGHYVELGYNVLYGRSDCELIPHIRYETYDTQNEVEAGFSRDRSKDRTNITLGLAAKPLSNLIFKADYIIGKNQANTGTDQWNLGFGWNF